MCTLEDWLFDDGDVICVSFPFLEYVFEVDECGQPDVDGMLGVIGDDEQGCEEGGPVR